MNTRQLLFNVLSEALPRSTWPHFSLLTRPLMFSSCHSASIWRLHYVHYVHWVWPLSLLFRFSCGRSSVGYKINYSPAGADFGTSKASPSWLCCPDPSTSFSLSLEGVLTSYKTEETLPFGVLLKPKPSFTMGVSLALPKACQDNS